MSKNERLAYMRARLTYNRMVPANKKPEAANRIWEYLLKREIDKLKEVPHETK